MLIGVPRETAAGETRVAVTPETAKKLKAQGHAVRVAVGRRRGGQRHRRRLRRRRRRDHRPGRRLRLPTWCSRCARRSPTSCALMKTGAALVGMLNPFDRDGLAARWPPPA